MKGISAIYDKEKLIRIAMSRFKITRNKAKEVIKKYLEEEDKRIPDIQKIIDNTLSEP